MLPIRRIILDYGRSCERLLSSRLLDAPLTSDEMQLIRYYLREMEHKFDSGTGSHQSKRSEGSSHGKQRDQ
jgi:hypothetical protein